MDPYELNAVPAHEGMRLALYITYLLLSTGATVWVGRTLFRYGPPFLVDAFHGQEKLADAVNRLLLVGFYLINLGWMILSLRSTEAPVSPTQVIELAAEKIGVVLLVLGGMHFFNLHVLSRIRRRALVEREPPPIRPSTFLNPQPSEA
jgi:hypothetical protein